MVAGHMAVPQFRGPITYCVLQWCHPMLTGTQRRTSCSTRMITLFGDRVIKLDSGPRRVYLVPGGGVYLVPGGGVPGPGGGVPGPGGGCTWSQGGVYLVPGGCTWSRGGCTWSRGGVPGPGGGVPGPGGGVPGPGGGTWSGGVYLVPGGVYLVPGGVPGQVLPPPVNRITHTCKNITLPQLRCGR